MTIQQIFVIGAGTMGSGIAQTAATSGYTVTCLDAFPAALEKAQAAIAKSTAKLLEKGQLSVEQHAAAGQIRFENGLKGLGEADLVIEAASENPELKFKLFQELDAAARPGAILASNTSSISITRLAAQTDRPFPQPQEQHARPQGPDVRRAAVPGGGRERQGQRADDELEIGRAHV